MGFWKVRKMLTKALAKDMEDREASCHLQTGIGGETYRKVTFEQRLEGLFKFGT